jgi:hypothetical protein
VRWCAVAEFPTLIGTIDGNSGCPVFSFRKSSTADSCDTATVIDTLPPGTWWFFAAPDFSAFGQNFCADGPHKYTAWLTPACGAAKGDMNGVGGLTAADAILMLNCAFLGSGVGTVGGDCNLCYSDVNCEGNLTASDAVLELNRIFLGSTAPPWCGL